MEQEEVEQREEAKGGGGGEVDLGDAGDEGAVDGVVGEDQGLPGVGRRVLDALETKSSVCTIFHH